MMTEPKSRPFRTRTFAALENRDYRRFYGGQGISLIGSWLQAAAVSWIVFDRTHSERWLGFVEAAGVVPGLLVGLFAGAMADRVRPKRMILGAQIIQMSLAFLLGIIVAGGIERVWALAGIVALTRVFVTFEMPSRQVLIHELVGKEGLPNAIALNSGLFNASRIVGPALAGVCLSAFGEAPCFALNGLSYLAAIAALLSIRTEDHAPPRNEAKRSLGELLGGLGYLRANRRVGTLFVLVIGIGVLGMGYSALAAAYARKVLGTKEGGYSTLLSCGGVGATVGALFVASLGTMRRRDRLVIGGISLFAVALAACGTLPLWVGPIGSPARLYTASACLMGVGFGAVMFYASAQTMIQSTVPDHLRGRVMGIWMIAYSGSVPLGCIWAGELAQRRGVPTVMVLSSALCAAMALVVAASGLLREADPATSPLPTP